MNTSTQAVASSTQTTVARRNQRGLACRKRSAPSANQNAKISDTGVRYVAFTAACIGTALVACTKSATIATKVSSMGPSVSSHPRVRRCIAVKMPTRTRIDGTSPKVRSTCPACRESSLTVTGGKMMPVPPSNQALA